MVISILDGLECCGVITDLNARGYGRLFIWKYTHTRRENRYHFYVLLLLSHCTPFAGNRNASMATYQLSVRQKVDGPIFPEKKNRRCDECIFRWRNMWVHRCVALFMSIKISFFFFVLNATVSDAQRCEWPCVSREYETDMDDDHSAWCTRATYDIIRPFLYGIIIVIIRRYTNIIVASSYMAESESFFSADVVDCMLIFLFLFSSSIYFIEFMRRFVSLSFSFLQSVS